VSSEPIQGLKDLEAALDAFPDRIAKSAVQRVLRRAAEPIRAMWSAAARVRKSAKGGHGPPGRFKGSIKVSSALERAVRKFQASRTAPAAVAYVGPTKDGYPEALFEEFGTTRYPPQAPGRRAWESEGERALAIFMSEIGPEIEKTAARLAKRLSK
jgi:hypothetical protein